MAVRECEQETWQEDKGEEGSSLPGRLPAGSPQYEGCFTCGGTDHKNVDCPLQKSLHRMHSLANATNQDLLARFECNCLA